MKKLVGVVFMFILATSATAQTATAPQPVKRTTTVGAASAPAQSHVGRYQLFFSPHARADVYLVDTETGRIWKPITITNAKDTNLKSAPEVWVYQERIDSAQDFNIWMATHESAAGAPTPSQ